MPARPLAHGEFSARAYAPELDGLRAVAVLLVIACHIQGQAFAALSGFLGVTVFFVLSGYLITALALREEAQRGRSTWAPSTSVGRAAFPPSTTSSSGYTRSPCSA
jgi:peptidoglycan/LPS O-acetylase OafA/YrhL